MTGLEPATTRLTDDNRETSARIKRVHLSKDLRGCFTPCYYYTNSPQVVGGEPRSRTWTFGSECNNPQHSAQMNSTGGGTVMTEVMQPCLSPAQALRANPESNNIDWYPTHSLAKLLPHPDEAMTDSNGPDRNLWSDRSLTDDRRSPHLVSTRAFQPSPESSCSAVRGLPR